MAHFTADVVADVELAVIEGFELECGENLFALDVAKYVRRSYPVYLQGTLSADGYTSKATH